MRRLLGVMSLGPALALVPPPQVVVRRGVHSMLPPHLAEAQELIKTGEARLVDVREVNEWTSAHFKSAQLVPLSELQRGKCPPELMEDQTRRLYLHCAGGVRVHPAKAIFGSLGFDDVVALGESMAELYEQRFDELADRE
ncbi:hypothetical protein CTAYLR_002672 [Chrysophaeum taylorii]|uniref:Rhodanese domain-containing protein n=1 Tax=Chrysophaeum taylorii TaxID=2483200 RepID=A0AAD7UDC9_9STRA|nr:hypothetical protein CTAYLR_002672 [Chrysophaeum taylorii]